MNIAAFSFFFCKVECIHYKQLAATEQNMYKPNHGNKVYMTCLLPILKKLNLCYLMEHFSPDQCSHRNDINVCV